MIIAKGEIMNIVAFGGSLRRASYNSALLATVKQLAAPAMHIDIRTLQGIPLFNEDEEQAGGKPDAVKALDAAIRAARAVIIATPEYNFGMPGGLKNASDWLSRHGSPLNGKPVGIMGASQGPVGTARVQYDLRKNLQAHEALVMPKPEIFVAHAQGKFDANGELADETTREHLAKWLAAFAKWIERVG
jgi:chromate reductase